MILDALDRNFIKVPRGGREEGCGKHPKSVLNPKSLHQKLSGNQDDHSDPYGTSYPAPSSRQILDFIRAPTINPTKKHMLCDHRTHETHTRKARPLHGNICNSGKDASNAQLATLQRQTRQDASAAGLLITRKNCESRCDSRRK